MVFILGKAHVGEMAAYGTAIFTTIAVKSVNLRGEARLELQLDEQPSGLGWLPDGRLLVVCMESLTLKRLEKNGLVLPR